MKGFTLLETLIVVSIIVVLAGAGIVSFVQNRNVRDLSSTGQNILSTLRFSQSKSLSGEDNSIWGVRLEQDRFILFRGADFASSTSTQIFNLNSNIEIANINLAGGGNEIVFEKLNGATLQYGAFEARIKSSPAKIFGVSVGSAGKIYQTGPAGGASDNRLTDTRHRNFNLGWSIQDADNLRITFSDPPNPNVVYDIDMDDYFNSGQTSFDWSDSLNANGAVQTFRIHTVSLTGTNTTLSVDHDCRLNNKQANISVDSKDIATYSADCQTVTAGPYGGTVIEP